MTRDRFVTALVSAGLLVALAETTARAQSPAVASSAQEATAQALFDEAKRLLADGHVAEACQTFQASQKVDPGAGTELNLAACYEQAGQLASAWLTFKSAGVDARRSARPEWGIVADTRAENLERLVPRVLVRVATQHGGASVEVELDGQPLASELLGSAIPLDPGDHRFVAKAAGRVPFERIVTLSSGGSETVDVPPLVALPPPAPETPSPPAPPRTNRERVAGISVAGAGIVGIGLGVYFGLNALTANSQAQGQCPTGQCGSQEPVDLTNEARTSRTESIVAFGAGGALSAAGIALLVLSTRHHPAPVTPAATVGREGWSVGVSGTF